MKRPELSKKYNGWNRAVEYWQPLNVDYSRENVNATDTHGVQPSREPRNTMTGSSFDMLEGA